MAYGHYSDDGHQFFIIFALLLAIIFFGLIIGYYTSPTYSFEKTVYDKTPMNKTVTPEIVREIIHTFVDNCIGGDDPLCECHEAIDKCYGLETDNLIHNCRILAASAMKECYKVREE